MMSSICSVPTEIRMPSSVTPESRRSCSDSCSCVVDHGWMARVLESPTLDWPGQSAWFAIKAEGVLLGQVGDQPKAVDDLTAGRRAALDAERQNTAEPTLQVAPGRFVTGVVFQAGVRHPTHVRMVP